MSNKEKVEAEVAEIDRYIELIKEVFDSLAMAEHRPKLEMFSRIDTASTLLSVKHWPDENSPTDAIWHQRGLVCHLLRLHYIGARDYAKDEPAVSYTLGLVLDQLITERRFVASVLKRDY